MPSAPFFHLDALRSVLDGTAAAARTESDSALARDVFPLPYVTAGALLWPQEYAHGVLHEWARWTCSVPDDVTSAGRLLRFPRAAGVPGTLRGRAFVAIEVAIPREPWVAEGRLASLRRLEPEIDTVALTSTAGVPPMHLGLDLPEAAIGRHVPLRTLTHAVVDAFVAAAGPSSGSPLASAELRHLGRAYALSAATRATSEEDASRIETRLDLLVERVAPQPRPTSNGRATTFSR